MNIIKFQKYSNINDYYKNYSVVNMEGDHRKGQEKMLGQYTVQQRTSTKWGLR